MVIPVQSLIAGMGLFSEVFARKRQQALEQAALNETRRSNMAQEQLAKAGSIDANGNRVRYIDGIGFVSEPSAVTKNILDAGNREQLANLREDQPRERAAAVRRDNRSQSADKEYQDAFKRYQYGNKRTEGQDVSDEVLATVADREAAGSDPNSYIAAVRTGNPSSMRGLLDKTGARTSLTSALIRAQQQGRGRFLSEQGAKNNNDFNELQQLRNIADGTGDTSPMMSNANEELFNRQESSKNNLINVMANNGSRTSNMLNNMTKSAQPLDLRTIMQAYKYDDEKANPDPRDELLKELMFQQKMSNANYSLLNDKYKAAKIYKQGQGML